ncbi:nucleotidyltransferase family protein [Psychrobacter urativorans]|uniref:nucleotidyltransferase family protein n=1 Tax=Psychrobacter urativorans TaxID=45610 RepID=UPI001D11B014|nr:nucleotidyltransferase family protein [Psychrobacter urativorans]
MPMINDHAVIILASGLSQRLGQSKQLLSKNGEPLICYMTKLALVTQPNAVIVVIPQGQAVIANATAKLVSQNSMIDIVVNSMPETGMARSLYLGIEALTKVNLDNACINRVLIMGVDQVLLDSPHLTDLLAGKHTVVASSYQHLKENHLNEQRLDETISTGESEENIVGLPIMVSYELLRQWQSALIGDKGLRHLIRALPSNQISTVTNHQLSYDIDTPNQLAHAKQQNWLDN